MPLVGRWSSASESEGRVGGGMGREESGEASEFLGRGLDSLETPVVGRWVHRAKLVTERGSREQDGWGGFSGGDGAADAKGKRPNQRKKTLAGSRCAKNGQKSSTHERRLAGCSGRYLGTGSSDAGRRSHIQARRGQQAAVTMGNLFWLCCVGYRAAGV